MKLPDENERFGEEAVSKHGRVELLAVERLREQADHEHIGTPK